jgi:hypothetical protein
MFVFLFKPRRPIGRSTVRRTLAYKRSELGKRAFRTPPGREQAAGVLNFQCRRAPTSSCIHVSASTNRTARIRAELTCPSPALRGHPRRCLRSALWGAFCRPVGGRCSSRTWVPVHCLLRFAWVPHDCQGAPVRTRCARRPIGSALRARVDETPTNVGTARLVRARPRGRTCTYAPHHTGSCSHPSRS